MRVVLLSVVLLFSLSTNGYPLHVTLEWNPNTQPDLAGYYFYLDTNKGHPYYESALTGVEYSDDGGTTWNSIPDLPPINLGSGVTEISLRNLDSSVTYFFAVRAYDDQGRESEYSNEVSRVRVESITSDDGSYKAGEDIDITVNFSEDVTLSGGHLIAALNITGRTIEIGPFTSKISVSGTYVVQDGDNSSDLNVTSISLSAGTLQNGNGVDCNLSLPMGTNLADNNDIIVDTVAPSTGTITIVDSNGYTNDAIPTLEVSSSGADYMRFGLTEEDLSSASWVRYQSSYSAFDISSGGDGSKIIWVEYKDEAGNIQTTHASDSTIYDRAAPDPPVITTNSGNDYSTDDFPITLEGTCAADTVAIYVNGSQSGVTYTAGETCWAYIGALESSNNTFTIVAYDSAGNASTEASITITNTNRKPDTPILSWPTDGETGVSLMAELQTEGFSDPDSGNTHGQSQWQISMESDFSTLLLDITGSSHLTSLRVPQSILDEGVTFFWRVRFYDNNLTASDWPEPYSFTTVTTLNDQNTNGIPDDQEVDSTVDLDRDGTPDINQSDMKCVNTVVGDEQVCVKTGTNVVSIESLRSVDPDTISDTTNKPERIPFGLIAFKLKVNNPSDTAKVALYSSVVTKYTKEDLQAFMDRGGWYYKYDSINGWQDYSDHSSFSEDRKSITLELRDQGFGDADGTANGIIVDPSGLGFASASQDGDGGCFIATAAFGSDMDWHVKILSEFRDRRLLTNSAGSEIVNLYYKFSLPAADYLRQYTLTRAAVRYAIIPKGIFPEY